MDPLETPPLKQIRTFQGDVAEALQKQRGSLVSIQQAEQLKKGSIKTGTNASLENTERRKEFFFLLLGSLLLLVLGTTGAWYAYTEFVRKSATPLTTTLANRFVATDVETILPLPTTSRETIINTLSEATRGVEVGQVKHVVLLKSGAKDTTDLLPTGEFLKMLGTQAPGSLVRAFDPLFMFGAYGESIFLIIKLVSFENAFAGMLAWEKNLSQDIGPLFATAPLLRNIPPGSTFSDITDKNKDVRILSIGDQPILLYSFFDNNVLVITDRLETLRTIIDRLTREKLSR